MFDKQSFRKLFTTGTVFCVVLIYMATFALEKVSSPIKNNSKIELASVRDKKDQESKEPEKTDDKTTKKAKGVDAGCVIPEQSKKPQSIAKEVEKAKSEIKVSPKKESAERTITISNEITDEMLTYKKHWSGHHSPSQFVVSINDQEIKKGAPTTIKVKDDDTINVSFNYEFRALGRVQRSGGRKLQFKVPKEVEKVTSTFSWDAPSNVVLDKAQLISSTDIS